MNGNQESPANSGATTLSKTVVISDCAPMDLAFIRELRKHLPDMTILKTVSSPKQAPSPQEPPAPPRQESLMIRLERLISRRVLPDETLQLLEEVPNRTISENDLNGEKGHALIRELNPDIIVTRRTCILKDSLFELARLPINIHLGLSPDYRGNHTLFWASFNGDLYAMAVTVHRLAPGIDDGDIYGITRPNMRPWNPEAILAIRMLKQSVEIIARLVQAANRNGGTVPSGKPQTEKGRLYLDRHRTAQKNSQYILFRRWRFPLRRFGKASTQVFFDESN